MIKGKVFYCRYEGKSSPRYLDGFRAERKCRLNMVSRVDLPMKAEEEGEKDKEYEQKRQ